MLNILNYSFNIYIYIIYIYIIYIEKLISDIKYKYFKKYTEFRLENKINIKNYMYLIDKLNNEKHVRGC